MISPPQRLVFAGTPAFAASILRRMLEAGLPIHAVLTQPDRPAGRGRRLTASPVKQLAREASLTVHQPSSLKRTEDRAELAALAPDLLVVAAYGLILPQAVLDLPAYGCLNVHASLLPRWRGAAPVERAIMAGDQATGVCIMQMDAGLDTGPVRLRRRCTIGAHETGGELTAKLAELGAAALIEVLADLPGHPPEPQPEAGFTYARKLGAEDARLDLGSDAETQARRIRAMNPSKPIAATVAGTRLQLLRANAVNSVTAAAPGTILSTDADGVAIACRKGVLRILEARVLRGKSSVMDAATLMRTQHDLLYPGALLEPA